MKDNPFWVFSTGFYAREGVAAECLRLQDEHGVDVNLLLYCLWCASLGRALDRDCLEALDSAVAEWRDKVVVRLRGLRRSLTGSGVDEIREAVKAAELLAEQWQQRMMYELFSGPGSEPGDGLGGELRNEPGGNPPMTASVLRDNLASLAAFTICRPRYWKPLICIGSENSKRTFGTVLGMDAEAEPTWMYSRRVPNSPFAELSSINQLINADQTTAVPVATGWRRPGQ